MLPRVMGGEHRDAASDPVEVRVFRRGGGWRFSRSTATAYKTGPLGISGKASEDDAIAAARVLFPEARVERGTDGEHAL